jgi:prephenate dehydratase
VFYVDFEGNVDRETTQSALHDLGEVTTFLKVLGSYPTGRAGAS